MSDRDEVFSELIKTLGDAHRIVQSSRQDNGVIDVELSVGDDRSQFVFTIEMRKDAATDENVRIRRGESVDVGMVSHREGVGSALMRRDC